MLTIEQLDEVIGADAYTEHGDRIGTVSQVYVDDTTGHPTFATVHTGLFGLKETFVPIGEATFNGTRLTVPYDKDTVGEAPRTDPDGRLTTEEVQGLHRHYGLADPGAVGLGSAHRTTGAGGS